MGEIHKGSDGFSPFFSFNTAQSNNVNKYRSMVPINAVCIIIGYFSFPFLSVYLIPNLLEFPTSI